MDSALLAIAVSAELVARVAAVAAAAVAAAAVAAVAVAVAGAAVHSMNAAWEVPLADPVSVAMTSVPDLVHQAAVLATRAAATDTSAAAAA